jgi:hypothetical protein
VGELDGEKVGSTVGKVDGYRNLVGVTDGKTEGDNILFVAKVKVEISLTYDDDKSDKDWSWRNNANDFIFVVKFPDSILFLRTLTDNSAVEISSLEAEISSYWTSYVTTILTESNENTDKSVTESEIDMMTTLEDWPDNNSMKATNSSCDRVLKSLFDIPIKI